MGCGAVLPCVANVWLEFDGALKVSERNIEPPRRGLHEDTVSDYMPDGTTARHPAFTTWKFDISEVGA
jgi:hypothetical protein